MSREFRIYFYIILGLYVALFLWLTFPASAQPDVACIIGAGTNSTPTIGDPA